MTNARPSASRDHTGTDESLTFWQEYRLLHPSDCRERPRDLERMSRFLQNDPRSVNRPLGSADDRARDYVPLMYAIGDQHVQCVKLLLEAGADPNKFFERSPYPLEDIVSYELRHPNLYNVSKYIKILKLLLKYGANPNKLTHISYILNEAVCTGILDVVMILLKYGANINDIMTEDKLSSHIWNERYSLFTTPLYVAMIRGEAEIAKRIFLHGGILNLSELIELDIVTRSEPPIPHQLIRQLRSRHDVSVSYYDSFMSSCDGRRISVARMLRLYKEMGGDIWVQDRLGMTVFQVLEVTDLSESDDENEEGTSKRCELHNLLTALIAAPLSLQSLARVVVVRAMGRGCWDNISELPIPKDIKRILRFRKL